MILPQNRLLFWFGAVVVPFAALATVMPSSAAASGAVISVFVFVASLDAAFSLRKLEGLGLEFPGVVRLTKGCEGSLELAVRNETGGAVRLRLGLAFPGDFLPGHEELSLDLPPGTSSHMWPCTPLKRGRYFFKSCYLEHSSNLGLWARRSAVPAGLEVRVYPNLSDEKRRLASIFLNRGNFGIHAQRHVGQGRDFEKLREYIYGDNYDSIHWKATAKRGRPITKVFQIERTQEVYVIIDASRLSARLWPSVSPVKHHMRGTGNGHGLDTILERYVTAALVMGAAAERQGDRYGLLTFSNKVHRFLRASSGKAHFDGCREALYELEPAIVTPDFDELGTFISLRLKKRALLVFLTNLDDPVLTEGFARNAGLLCRRHLVLAGMVKPPGARPVFSDSMVDSLDGVYESLGGHMLWHGLRELDKTLQRRGVGFFLLEGEKACSQLVSQYLSIKERQLL